MDKIARRNCNCNFVAEYCEHENTLNKYKQLKMILRHFKKRFYDEYMLPLRETSG